MLSLRLWFFEYIYCWRIFRRVRFVWMLCIHKLLFSYFVSPCNDYNL